MARTRQEMSAKQLAEAFHTDDTTIRKFLREVTPKENHPGSGSRWVIPQTKTEISRLKKRFENWSEHHSRLVKSHQS